MGAVWNESRTTVERRSTDGQSLRHPSVTHLSKALKYAACLLIAFVLGIGNVWGGTITWSFANSGSKVDLSQNNPHQFTGNDSSTKLYYTGASGDELAANGTFIKINGASSVSSDVYTSRYFTFTAPSSAGTLTFECAGTAGTTLVSTGTNGTVILATVTNTANKSVTSAKLEGLTAGSTTIYIQNVSKSYFKSITWTDAEAPSYASAYYSLVKTSMTGATLTASSATQQTGGSNLYADFANYYKTGNSTGYVNISFANPNTPIALNSNGSDCGRIKIYYGHTGAGNGFSLDVNSSTGVASYSATIAKRIYIAEYTIPDGTSSISSLKMTGSGSSGLYICAIDILTYSSGGGGDDPGDDPGDTPANYAVTHSLSNNVVAKSGDTGASAATEGSAYNAVFANSPVGLGYSLPSTIGVTIGGEAATVGTDYTWNSSTGAFQVPAEKVTGAIVVTIAGVAPVKAFRSDFSAFTQVGETNDYYSYLDQTNYVAYAKAGWMKYAGADDQTGSKKLTIDPATDEAISGTSKTYAKIKQEASKYMEFYVTGITAVKFYFYNDGSDTRTVKYKLNGGEETDLVAPATKTCGFGSIALDAESQNTIRIYASNDVYACAMKVTLPDASCAAGVPGDITKGTASGGTGAITLTAAGSAKSGDTWYWQSAADGVLQTDEYDAENGKVVSLAGTYYLRSYNASGTCWSDAKSVTVAAADLLTAITPTLSYDASVIVGNTLSPTLTGNDGNGSVVYALNNVNPAGSLTINSSTGVVTAVTAEGTATVTATIAANGNYAGNTATSGTITAVANPLGTHTLTWTMKVGKSEYSSLLDEPSSTSTYMTAGGTLNYGSSTTIDAGNKGAENRTIKVFGVATSTEEHGAESYVEFPFTITSGYTFTPTAVSVKVANVETTKYYDLVLLNADGSQSVARATFESEKTDGSVETISWSSISGLTLRGSGKLRVYAFNRGATDGFRFGTPITITGTVAEYVAPVDYTVTINPNGGAYASTPTGWTYSEGVYTKTVTGGTSFSAPEGLEKGTDELSWKDGLDNVVEFPTTISGDITFIAQWTPYVESSNADLSALSVAGCTLNETFAKGTTAYTTNLPFGSSMPAVSAVTATKDDAKAADPLVSISGNVITVHCVAENGTTEKDYTITVTIADSKDIRMVWKTEGNPCGESSAPSAVVLSTNDAIKDYLSISFVQTTEDNDKKAEEKSGSYLSTGKSVGNLVKITAKPGFAFKNMSFFGKIESSEVKCPVSINGGESWIDVTGTVGSNAQHCDVFINAETHEIILKNNAGAGTWLRHMDLTMIQACTPKTIAWTTAPASEYEVGKAGYAIAASANNGTVEYTASNAAITVAANGALTINSLTNDIDLSASVAAGDGTTYCASSASVVKEEIKTYYLVTFDAQNETAATPVKYYSGDAAIALPNPSYPGFVFQGWFDAAEGGNQITEDIIPTASRTVYAQWVAQCAGPIITTQPGNANYFVGRTATTLVGAASASNEGELTYTWYSCDDELKTNSVALAGAPTPSTAVAGTQYYYFTVTEAGCDVVRTSDVAVITVTEKDQLLLIKIATTGSSNKTVTGYCAKEADCAVDIQSDRKFGSNHYMKMALNDEEFQAGDIFNVHITTVAENGYISLYSTNGSQDALLYNSGVRGVVGNNRIPLTDAIEGYSTLFLCRTSGNSWNAYVDFIEVYRPYPVPVLKAMTINGSAATINGTNVTATIASNAELASLDIDPTFMSNDPTQTNGALGDWTEVSEGVYTASYVVTDKDEDTNTYLITLTRDVEIASITISGETSVMEGSQITLTATVLPNNVINKAVVWTSSDETKAEVDENGVVTAKAAGAVTITATSVADNTKFGTYDITVTGYIGTKRVYWFAYADDAAANDVSNNSTVFGSAPTGSNSGAKEITLEEGWVMNTTKYAGAPGSTGTFVVPAEYTATFYAAAKASGNGGRYIQLKQGDDVKYTSNEFEGNDPQVVKIEGVAAGTYTIAYFGGMSNFYLYAAELSRYAITSVTLESGFTLRTEDSRTPDMTIVHVKAAIASQTWSILSSTATGTTINESTGEITAGTTPGTITVQVEVTDAMSNVVTSNICTVEIVEEFERIDVTGSMTWNWNELSMSAVNVSADRGLALANYIEGEKWQMLNGTNGDYAYRNEASGCYEAMNGSSSLSFHTTVPGMVKITGRRRSNDAVVKINGEITVGTVTSSVQTFDPICVAPGEVAITPDANGMRITKLEFIAMSEFDPAEAEESKLGGNERTVDPQYYGTVCLPKAGVMTGAMLFQVAYMDYKEDGTTPYKVYYDQVENGVMQAGMPYIFLAEESTIGVYYTGTAEETAKDHNGLHGTLVDMVDMSGTGIYMLYNNKVLHSTNSASSLPANRAYLQISEIPGYNNPGYKPQAPKYRRISTNFNGTNSATGMEEVNSEELRVKKMLINGQIYILRGEKMYDATGRLVK